MKFASASGLSQAIAKGSETWSCGHSTAIGRGCEQLEYGSYSEKVRGSPTVRGPGHSGSSYVI